MNTKIDTAAQRTTVYSVNGVNKRSAASVEANARGVVCHGNIRPALVKPDDASSKSIQTSALANHEKAGRIAA